MIPLCRPSVPPPYIAQTWRAKQEIWRMRRIHIYNAWRRGEKYSAIARLYRLSPERVRQIVGKEETARLRRWRRGGRPGVVRGESPIHTEPWSD